MENLKILFLASHWRVSLIRAFQDSKSRFKGSVNLICADSDRMAPSFKEADLKRVIPLFSETGCLNSLLEICRTEQISALVPLTNKAIEFLAQHREELENAERKFCISENRVIDICHDKWKLYEFLKDEGFTTPQTFLAEQVKPLFPLIAKPRRGEGSKELLVIEDQSDLKFYAKKRPYHVFQHYIEGREFSVDVFFDQQGLPRLIVPRERLAVRGGEVMVSRINMNDEIIDQVEKLGTSLKMTGPGTIQGIRDATGKFYFTDVNLRFGSGFIHTLATGGDVPLMMFKELAGLELDENRPAIKNHSVMTRFPESIYYHQ